MPDFNPHKHVKIWFSTDENSFLTSINIKRLIEMRIKNPTDEINFLYESRLLSATALSELKSFCKNLNITPLDIAMDIFPNSTSAEELDLITIYEEELCYLQRTKQVSSTAIMADIMRWFFFVLNLGTYSDFDKKVNTQGLGDRFPLKAPIIFEIGSIKSMPSLESVVFNNCVIIVANTEESSAEIIQVQRAIYNACSAKRCCNSSFHEYHSALKKLSTTTDGYDASFMFLSEERRALLATLDSAIAGKSITELRREIFEITSTNETYLKCLDDSNDTPLARYFRRIDVEKIPDGDLTEFLEKSRLQDQTVLIKEIVIACTGPRIVHRTLFPDYTICDEEVMNDMQKSSLSANGLDQVFIDKYSCPFHVDFWDYIRNVSAGDFSWMPQGAAKVNHTSREIDSAVIKLQKIVRGFFSRKETASRYYSDGKYKNHVLLTPSALNTSVNNIPGKEDEASKLTRNANGALS